MSGGLVGEVAEELHRVARRVLPRAFRHFGGEPPLDLPELRKTAERILPGTWNEAALERVLRGGAGALGGSFGKVGKADAALVLFNLDGHAIPGADYGRIRERLAEASGVADDAAVDELVRDLAAVLVGPAVRITARDTVASLLATLDDEEAAPRRTVKPLTAAIALATAAVVAVGATILVAEIGGDDGELKTASADSPPVKVQDITTFRNSEQDARYVLSEAVAEPPPRGAATGQAESFDDWYGAHGGTVLEAGFTNITVQGNDSKPVRITDMKILPECFDLHAGTFLQGYTQGGGQDTVKIGFDLDNPNPVPEQMTVLDNNLQGLGLNYFAVKTVELAPGATEVFTVGVRTKNRHCKFKLKLVVATVNGTFEQEIDAPDKRFEVTGLAVPKSADAPYSGYRKVYRQDATLSWNSVDPNSPEGK